MISPYEKIPFYSFTALIQAALPKKTFAEKVRIYALELFPTIESFLKMQGSDFVLILDGVPLNTNPEDKRHPRIWTHKDLNGVHLVYIPDLVDANLREDGILETIVTRVFVSRFNPAAFQVTKAIALDYSEKRDGSLNQEMANRKIALNLPFGTQYFTPLELAVDGFAVKCPEYERLTSFLSALEFLKVLDGVFGGLKVFEDAGFVSLDITPDNIAVKRGNGGMIEGKIDYFGGLTKVGSKISQLTNRRQNVLAQSGYACTETARYALVVLIAERVFLDLEAHLDWGMDGFEKHALKRIKNFVSDIHYQEVLQLKLQYEGFQGGFSQDLLNYVERIRREGEESFQCSLLDQFAHNMALFPEVTALLMRTVEVDLEHRALLTQGNSYEEVLASEFKIPTIEEIYKTLQPCKSKLENLRVEKESTNVSLITISVAEKIAYKVLPEERYHEAHACIDAFWQVLNECLDCFPSVGSEVRVHRDVFFSDKGVISPFSFWLRVERDRLVLEIFDQRVLDPLGSGSYKKVKAGVQAVIHAGGTLTCSPIAISRLKDGSVWDSKLARGNELLDKLMLEPGSAEYFAAPLRKHAPHEVGRKGKLEAVSIRFQTTLYETLKNHAIKIKERNFYLSKLEEISFLESIGEGIKRIADKELSHQDIKTGNIALILKEGRLKALIFDFDLASPCGELSFSESYYAWNALRYKYGYVSKETDLYGHILIVAETLLTGFRAYQAGETHENATLRLQTIARNGGKEKLRLKIESKNQIVNRYPYAFARDTYAFLSELSENTPVSEVPDSFFYYIQTLQKDAQVVGFQLKHFITEWLIFDRVFDLLVKTLGADLASRVKIEEKLKRMGIYSQVEEAALRRNIESLDQQTQDLLKSAASESLSEAGFPSYEEIQGILDSCKQVAREVDERISAKDSSWCVVS